MKFSSALALGLAGSVAASVKMEGEMAKLMEMKVAQRQRFREQGLFGGSAMYSAVSTHTPCVNGKSGVYGCKNVDMYGFLSHEHMGSSTKEGNDVWGWTSKSGREFAAVGQTDGTAFVEVLKGGSLKYLGRLPTQTMNSIWRDIKVINGYAYIGSEAPLHGLQVFNMRKLLRVGSTPKTFSTINDITWFKGFGSSHNIVAHEETNMIYAVGTTRELPCAGGLFMVDVSNPAKPKKAGCASEDGYVHDAQCVIYKGPQKQYRGREVCFNFNEDTLTIVDVTNKKAPKQISKTPYVGAAYTHQGWLVDESMKYILLDDELDEMDGKNPGKLNHTTTYIFDIQNLRAPKNTGFYQSPVKSIDHNQYVIDGITYQSNYNSGLRMVDVSSVHRDPTGKGFKEVGFFDVHPQDDDVGGVVEFAGSWSVYPYFKSGHIVLNSIERGLFSLKYTG